ncbi:MAG: beta-glucosidase [Lentisphaeria bacterium]
MPSATACLPYTQFAYSDLSAELKDKVLSVKFTIKNTGTAARKEVAQAYVAPTKHRWKAPKRLAAFAKVELQPDESKSLSLTVDPHLLAMRKNKDKTWKIAKQDYRIMLATSTTETVDSVTLRIGSRPLGVNSK